MALTDNIVAYYKFDESSGNCDDSVGTDDGTNVGTVTYTASVINNGAVFDRTVPKRFNVTGPGTLATGSVSVWIKGTFASNLNDYGIYSHDTWNGNGQPFIYIRRRDSESKVARMGFDTYGNSAEMYATSDISTSNWNHCVWTWSSVRKGANFFYNGNAIGTPTISTMRTPVFTSMRIGDGILTSRGFTGGLDEMGIWSRELSGAEVTALYNSGAGLQYPFSTTSIGSINGLAYGSVATVNGLAKASVSKINGLS